MTRANKRRGHWALSAALLVVSACDFDESRTPPDTTVPSGLGTPVSLTSALAFIEKSTGTVFMVSGPGGQPTVNPVLVGRSPVAWTARPGGADQLLVLTQGHRGGGGIDPEGPALWIVSASGAIVAAIPLPSHFNALSVSPDGRLAITYFAGKAGSAGEIVFNPNLMAIVDLSNPTAAPVARSLRSKGSVPLGFDFSPPIGAANGLTDGARDLVVVRSTNYVTLMDLTHPVRPEITVPLVLEGDGRTLTPVQVLFDVADATIYVRVTGSSDVFALRMEKIEPTEQTPGGNDFRPSLSQLAGGKNPSDMQLYREGNETRLLVVGVAPEVVVIDARSSRTLSVPLDHAANQILRFDQLPGETVPRARALLVGGSQENRVTFVELEHFEELKTRSLDTEAMAGQMATFQAFPAQGLALVQHQGGAGASVINLGTRSITPLSANINIQRMRTNSVQPGRVWILTQFSTVAFLDLATLAIGELRLDAAVADLMVAAPGAGPGSLLLVHPGAEGYVTVADAAVPTRATAHSIRGFAATNLLARTERALP